MHCLRGMLTLGLLLTACDAPSAASSGGLRLSWPSMPEQIQQSEFRSQAQGNLELEIDFFNADFEWKENGATKTARFLIPAIVGSEAESTERLTLSYGGERPTTPASPDFELRIPGVPVMSDGSLVVEGFARGMDDKPIMTGEITGIEVTAEGMPEYTISLVFTAALDADEDGYVPSSIGGGDCNEDDPHVFTGANEICDGRDTACDGRLDEVDNCAYMDTDGTPMQVIPEGEGYVGWRELEGVPETRVFHNAFRIDRYEVSLAQYAQCATTCTPPDSTSVATHDDYDATNYGDYPVVHIDWSQASAYCAYRGKRLPTEFEWEAAARGFDDPERSVPWEEGSGFSFDEVNANLLAWGPGGPSPVSVLPEGMSPFGVYNMMGNVAEWTASWYASTRYASVDEALLTVPPPEPTSGTQKVYKGGGWDSRVSESFPYQRAAATTDTTEPGLGFRCALDVP